MDSSNKGNIIIFFLRNLLSSCGVWVKNRGDGVMDRK